MNIFVFPKLERSKKIEKFKYMQNKLIVVVKMAEGICYVCNQTFTAASKDALVDKIVEHIMASHHGWVWGDAMQAKNVFEKCPVCGATLGKLAAKCPNCGADLVEQFARKVTVRYVKG